MRVDILTLFPGMFSSPFEHSIVKRAISSGRLDLRLHDIRDFSADKHRSVDDSPFGGGPGMVMMADPIFRAVDSLKGDRAEDFPVIYMSPKGAPFRQNDALRLSRLKRVALLCGHYEGIDQRVLDSLVSEEYSVGDFVVTGGELPAMLVVDAVSRLLPGVLGEEESLSEESFSAGLLEYPQYTRPAVYRGLEVPPILLSGNHAAIRKWRSDASLALTVSKRPDLLRGSVVPEEKNGQANTGS